MSVTIWDTTSSPQDVARVATTIYTPDPEDPEAPGTTEIVYGPPLARVTGGKWARPAWSDAMRAEPHLHGDNFKSGWVILRDVLVTPTLAAGEVRGALGTTPVVDLVAGTATWTYAVSTQPVAAFKGKRIEQIRAKADQLIAAGFVYSIPGSPQDPHTYQIDDGKSQLHMTSIGGLFALGVVDAHGGFWRDAANVNVTMSQAECEAFFAAAAAYKLGIIRRSQAMVDAVRDAANAAGVAQVNHQTGAINGDGGWPANG